MKVVKAFLVAVAFLSISTAGAYFWYTRNVSVLERVRIGSESELVVSKKVLIRQFGDVDRILSSGQWSPYFSANQQIGYRLDSVKSGEFFDALQFKRSEVVTKVGSVALDNPESVVSMLKELTRLSFEKLSVEFLTENGERFRRIYIFE